MLAVALNYDGRKVLVRPMPMEGNSKIDHTQIGPYHGLG
jgi:hypothetical protein